VEQLQLQKQEQKLVVLQHQELKQVQELLPKRVLLHRQPEQVLPRHLRLKPINSINIGI
jgi:hypothetical protein